MSLVLGWNVIGVPTDPPAPASVEWFMNDVVGVSRSPFTGKQQTYSWGGQWWSAKVTMPPMTQKQAKAWLAFLAYANGPVNAFFWGDAKADGTGTIGVGDWVQIGSRLYRILGGSSGAWTTWPDRRNDPGDSTTEVTAYPKGLFRLKSNTRGYTQGVTNTYITFEIEEAL